MGGREVGSMGVKVAWVGSPPPWRAEEVKAPHNTHVGSRSELQPLET